MDHESHIHIRPLVENDLQVVGPLLPHRLAQLNITDVVRQRRASFQELQPPIRLPRPVCIHQRSVVGNSPLHMGEVLLEAVSQEAQLFHAFWLQMLLEDAPRRQSLVEVALGALGEVLGVDQEGGLGQEGIGHVALHQGKDVSLATIPLA